MKNTINKKYLLIITFLASSWLFNIYSQVVIPDTTLLVKRIEDIRFNSQNFSITGSLYLPLHYTNDKIPVVIWVSGSGPSYRSSLSANTKRVVNCFLRAGYAYFRIDKPGYGDSKGYVNEDSLFDQLSTVVVDAVKNLKINPTIDTNRIGLFGSSQAGYIMPLAISKCKDISFMIGSSCPGENSIEQWNYLLEKQMLCEGYSPQKAKISIQMFSTLRQTTEKQKFDKAIYYFQKNPLIIKSVNYDSSFVEKAKKWWPRTIDTKDELHFNPTTIIKNIKIPIFIVYGNLDTQINPFQAIEAYKAAFNKSGNNFYRLKMLQGVDHNMCLTNSGCLNEISERNKNNNNKISDDYLDTLKEWLALIDKIK